ncbi:MAG TPA: heparan-alpha-glucosaminide N-acetyltransferase domain-containing protein [Gemmatimonadales bacterium]|nr:heparan-alpha-glucosaminide N-acetyltransferase domain-containing protein [Gemmatimonadales bacterium]
MTRIRSIDIARGIVMILMAIDHVRVYSGLPGGGPTPGIFFTRWVTHFCAPAFIFLAGTSAFLQQRAGRSISRTLLVRGLWLVLLELTVIRVSWTFNLDYAHYSLAGVIWAIGWSMVILAALVKLPVRVVAAIGLVIVAGHNLLSPQVPSITASLQGRPVALALWKIGYLAFFDGPISLGSDGPTLVVLYSIIPWVGVMATGYAFGVIITRPAPERDRLCLQIGLGATALFLLLRGTNLYGDPLPWTAMSSQRGLFAFLSPAKYPASLSFLLMTLGPTIAFLPALERWSGKVADVIAIFGRVPFFYYVLHIPLIHLLAIGVSLVRSGNVTPWLFANHPMGNPPPPDGYTWSLPLLYLVWAIAVGVLYLACRRYADLKARRRDWWMAYL